MKRRLCGLRRWPTPPAIGRGACRRRRIRRARTTCSSSSGGDVAARVELRRPVARAGRSRTGPVKPMASSTRSASSVNSVPGIGSNFGGGPTRTACSFFTLPCVVAGEADGGDAPVAHAAFFVRAFDAQLHRPQRPRRGGGALVGRLGQQLELSHESAPSGGARCPGNRRRCRRRR